MAEVIEAQDVKMAYRLDRDRPGTLKEFTMNMFRGKGRREKLWALKGVSFTVGPGEVFGVIGPNGAGKSTLMKVIARVLPPTAGRMVVRGSVAAMISLGAGFNPELTARENIVLYGTLLGRDTRLMKERVDPIIEWAELQEFVDVPTRSYSSGMLARLGFSVATDGQADVLVVDEVLAVGDEAFRRKSLARMRALIQAGSSVVFVSHALQTVRRICDRVMWLDHGEMIMLGQPDEVIDAYKASVEEPDEGPPGQPGKPGG